MGIGLDIRDIMDGQSQLDLVLQRQSRAQVGRLFGLKLKLKDLSISQSRGMLIECFYDYCKYATIRKVLRQKLIFMMPKSTLKVALYFKKALESLK